jgi:hypothetical protein
VHRVACVTCGSVCATRIWPAFVVLDQGWRGLGGRGHRGSGRITDRVTLWTLRGPRPDRPCSGRKAALWGRSPVVGVGADGRASETRLMGVPRRRGTDGGRPRGRGRGRGRGRYTERHRIVIVVLGDGPFARVYQMPLSIMFVRDGRVVGVCRMDQCSDDDSSAGAEFYRGWAHYIRGGRSLGRLCHGRGR